MNCRHADTCTRIKDFLDSRESEIPLFLRREFEVIAETPELLDLAHACIKANGDSCHLNLEATYGGSTSLKRLLRPIQP